MEITTAMFQLTSKTQGLPDTCILNDETKPDIFILAKFLKMSGGRKQRKHYERIFTGMATQAKLSHLKNSNLLDFYLDQEFRRHHFLLIAKDFSIQKKPKISPFSSFEFFVFNEIDDKFPADFERKEGCDYESLANLVSAKRFEEIKKFKPVSDALFNIWFKIKSRLKTFGSSPPTEQAITAGGVLGMATILGPRFFKEGLMHCPSLKFHFSYIMNQQANLEPFEEEDELVVWEHPTKEDLEDDDSEFLEEMMAKLGKSKDEIGRRLSRVLSHIVVEGFSAEDPPEKLPDTMNEALLLLKGQTLAYREREFGEEHIDFLEKMTSHLRSLLEASVSVINFEKAAELIRDFLFRFGEYKKVPGLDDAEFKGLYHASWDRYLAEDNVQVLENNGLGTMVESRTLGIDRLVDELDELISQLEAVQAEIGECEKREANGFVEKKNKAQELAGYQEQLASLRSQKEGAELILLEAFLPPGVTFENLEEHAKKEVEFPALSESSLSIIQATLAALEDEFIGKVTIPVAEDVEESPVPVAESEPDQAAPPVQFELQKDPEPVEEKAEVPEEVEVPVVVEPAVEVAVALQSPKEATPIEGTPIAQAATAPRKKAEPVVEPVVEPEEDETDEVELQVEDENEAQVINTSVLGCLEESGEVKAGVGNELALYCLDKDAANFGHYALRVLKSLCPDPENLIPAELLEVSYYGPRVFNTSSNAFAHTQRILNTFDFKRLESWLEHKSTAKLAPPLLFAACFQTGLFAGNLTVALIYLNSIKSFFDAKTTTLISDLIQFANSGKRVTLELLQQAEGVVQKQPRVPVKVQLSDWQDKIRNSSRGWAPVRIVLNKCLTEGVFAPVVQVISGDKRSKEGDVRDFVDKFSDEDVVKDLMHRMVADYSRAPIEAKARDSFLRTVADLVEISSRWLDEQAAARGTQDASDSLVPELKSRFQAALAYFENQSLSAYSKEGRIGNHYAAACLGRLLDVIGGKTLGALPDDRLSAWFDFPRLLITEDVRSGEDQDIIACLLKYLVGGFDLREMYQAALDKGAFHLAQLALGNLEAMGENVAKERSDLNETSDEALYALERQRGDLELSVGTANAAWLIEDERYHVLVSELEYIEEEIKGFSNFRDLRVIREDFSQIQDELDKVFAKRMSELRERYQALLTKGRAGVGPDVVPPGWTDLMEQAMATRDIPVIEEMLLNLEHAINEGRKIREDVMVGNPVFGEFLTLEAPLYQFLAATPDPKQLVNVGISDENPLGLKFPNRASALKAAIRAMTDLGKSKPSVKPNDAYLTNVSKILSFVGLPQRTKGDKIHVKTQIAGSFGLIQTQVECHPAGAPFTDFGVNQEHEANVLVSHKELDVADLEKTLETDLSGKSRLFLICTHPLSPELRNRFACFCKNNIKTVFLIDPAMLFYLGTEPFNFDGASEIRSYLLLAAPMTYYNSFVGDRMNPPDPEMRYGRQLEIDQVTDMAQGAAVVFGGRQLGKSTILTEGQDKFHSPEHKKFAFYYQGDAAFGEVIREVSSADRSRRLWSKVYDCFTRTGYLKSENNLDTDTMRTQIRECLERHRDLRVMIIFDEVDPLLEADHADGFAIFRSMRELVTAPASQGRFKLVISGLQNVKRFEDSPNYPLNQLGRSMNISIMSVSDAQKLIKEPLSAYGFTFESPLVVSRIMSLTNRHPGLMQIFCHELVRTMAFNHRESIGQQVITPGDVIMAFEKEGVQALIRQRFELTLNVDYRYAIIIYSLVLEGRGTQAFSSAQAREAAAYFLPEFRSLTDRQIEAILDELVGLGVLTKSPGTGFSLRNSNIVRLLGSSSDILDKILQAQSKKHKDPLTRHAYIDRLHLPSPLSFRDEKQILGIPEKEQDSEDKPGVKIPPKYVVSLVSGSAAQGLAQLETVLPNIVDYTVDEVGDKPQYDFKAYSDVRVGSLTTFSSVLRKQIGMALKRPQMILIKVTGERTAEETLAMIEIALLAREVHKKNPVKIIFSMNPLALWKWQSGPVDRDARTPGLVHVGLGRWNDTALESFLTKIGFPETGDRLGRLRDHSQGWYHILEQLAAARAEYSDLDTIPKLGTKVKKISEPTVKDAKDLLDKSGASALPWVLPVLKQLIEGQGGEDFGQDDLHAAILMVDSAELEDVPVQVVLNWLVRMNLVNPSSTAKMQTGPANYDIDPALRVWMSKGYE